MKRRGVTLVEAMIFGAIASVMLVGIIGLLTKGTTILELGRRTSGSATDFRSVLELLSEDVAELVYLEGGGAAKDAAGAGISFVIRSTRAERGVAPASSLRRVEYKLVGSGDDPKQVVRTVTAVGGGSGTGSAQITRSGIATLKAWPVAFVPQGSGYKLALASDGRAGQPGASVACLVVQIADALPPRDKAMENKARMSLVTKLWCRNRVLELARGVLQ
jgi:hypothetical protein